MLKKFKLKGFRWDYFLFAIAAVCFAIFGIISFQNMQLRKQADAVRDKLKTINQTGDNNVSEHEYISKYSHLFESNDDMVAWLEIPGTNINYPVMYTPEDEEYYLHRDFFGNEDKNGTLFLDTDCKPQDERANLIIHGHHMKSGAMFGELPKYSDKEYGDGHSKIYLYTPSETRVYAVMSVFQAKVYKSRNDKFKYYDYFRFDTQEGFDEYYENIKKMSMYDTGVTAAFGDEFITLSTCSYHTKNGRFAVVAKRIE